MHEMAMSRKLSAEALETHEKRTTKRKGLGGLSSEKKKLLKQLIVQKAAQDLRKLKETEAEERKIVISARVPELNINDLDENDLLMKVRELHGIVCRLEEEKYDWETRIKKQNCEINELNIRANDIKGHFVKPVLKKVSKAEQKFQVKFDGEKLKSKLQFLTSLRSTGQSKFALEEKDEVGLSDKRPDWSKEHQLRQHKDLESEEKKLVYDEPIGVGSSQAMICRRDAAEQETEAGQENHNEAAENDDEEDRESNEQDEEEDDEEEEEEDEEEEDENED